MFYVVPKKGDNKLIQKECTLDEADAVEQKVKELHGAERNVTVRELRQSCNRSMTASIRAPIVPDKYYYARVMGRSAVNDGSDASKATQLWSFAKVLA